MNGKTKTVLMIVILIIVYIIAPFAIAQYINVSEGMPFWMALYCGYVAVFAISFILAIVGLVSALP